eukprot:CAMPEP_0170481580 /NCGR_PEP_ID=MMETSP0208-20121228/1974_1 /TAXON_ID=197538 /ORGANISM="Strombidium inclinatum, Strain S3" /LENGTH=92 /DNA_ID=CAMNT_0010754313 /DNA_START=3027 /DNA_END=3305 /DNA_ORIENTATION=+
MEFVNDLLMRFNPVIVRFQALKKIRMKADWADHADGIKIDLVHLLFKCYINDPRQVLYATVDDELVLEPARCFVEGSFLLMRLFSSFELLDG